MSDKHWIEGHTPSAYRRYSEKAGIRDDVAEAVWKDASGYRNFVAGVLVSAIKEHGTRCTGVGGKTFHLDKLYDILINRALYNEKYEELPDR